MTHSDRGTALRTVRLVSRAWFALAAFDAARLAGFGHLASWLRRTRPAARTTRATAEEIVWAVEEACVWYPKRAACLQRSAAAAWLLRRHGLHAELVIGCRPLPFESHAWVEIDGLVVNDRQAYRRAFVVLDRL